MKIRDSVYLTAVGTFPEQREMEVVCWRCDSKVPLTLHWITMHHDICGADCGTLIILNTSRLQGEVVRLRQLETLHAKMSGVLTDQMSNTRQRQADHLARGRPAVSGSS